MSGQGKFWFFLRWLWNLASGRYVPLGAFRYLKWAAKRATAPAENVRVVSLEAYNAERASGPFKDFVENELAKEQPVDLHVVHYRPQLNDVRAILRSIRINPQEPPRSIDLRGRHVDLIEVTGVSVEQLRLTDCYVKNLSFGSQVDELRLERSWIGNISFVGVIRRIDISGGGVFKIENVPSAGTFNGPVSLRRFWISRDPALGASDTQQLRNFGKQLSELGLVPAASAVHAAELALDRRKEPAATRVFGWIYEVLSDFGGSLGRPLFWLMIAATLLTVMVYCGDAVSLSDSGPLPGWQESLKSSRWHRAVAYPLFSIFNPFGAFGKSLLVPASWIWALVLAPVSLLGTASLFFVALALRRRFKLAS